jgi:uncharacterized repeat protein (TIGR01451 family)
VEVPLTPTFDLGITKSVDKAEVKAGDTVTYTLVVTAAVTSGTMTNVVVTDDFPAQLSNPKVVSAPAGWTCTVTGQKVTCTKATFAFDEKAEFKISATVGSVPGGTVIKNVVAATTDQTETTLVNNSDDASIKVLLPAVELPIELPRTGNGLRLAGLAMLMLGAGFLLLASSRRRTAAS